MIWVDGRIVPEQELSISVLDRTFEHGLGLIETTRTWSGRAPLLDRHLARLRNSARELGLPLDASQLPDAGGVAELLRADGLDGDVALRLTLTGGLSESAGSVLWMRAAALPPPMVQAGAGAVVDYGPWRVERDDALLRHKTLNYWRRRNAYQQARASGFDEVVSLSDGPVFWEGSRTNLFLVAEATLITPALSGPIVPGIMRGLVIELARANRIVVREVPALELWAIEEAEEIFLTNSVRGIIPVSRLGTMEWDGPGAVTATFQRSVTAILRKGELT